MKRRVKAQTWPSQATIPKARLRADLPIFTDQTEGDPIVKAGFEYVYKCFDTLHEVRFDCPGNKLCG
ncbi:hypothetical protein LTR08_004814 [Meristemomyces frigidus]|nr:hypothetical protein LTR08_004814 [Meristemomyces frigidus]